MSYFLNLIFLLISGERSFEEDGQILKVIEAYCTSAKTRYTVNSGKLLSSLTNFQNFPRLFSNMYMGFETHFLPFIFCIVVKLSLLKNSSGF